MSTSAVSGTIDYLLTTFTTAAHTVDSQSVVVESWPSTIPKAGVPLVVVAAPHPDDATSADETRQYLALGSGSVEEAFDIPCYIDVGVGGLDQSVARKKACLVFDAFVDAIRADLTLGGNLKRGRFAQLTDITLVGTRDPDEAQQGRRSVLSFRVKCANFY